VFGEIKMSEETKTEKADWKVWWEQHADPESFLQEQLPRTENVRTIVYAMMKNLVERGGIILDVGCGPAVDYEAIRNMDFRWTGIDMTLKFVEYVKKKYNKDADIRLMDAERIWFKRQSFNLTYAKDLFEHLPPDKWQKVVKEMWRVSKDYMIIAFFRPPAGEPTEYRIVTEEDNAETCGVYSNHYNKEEWLEFLRDLPQAQSVSIKESIIYKKRWARPKGYSIWLIKRRKKDEDDDPLE